jgi:signal peptidase I
MRPAILGGDVLVVAPIKPGAIVRGDIILYRADEHIIAHRVIDIESAGSRISQLPNLSYPSSDDRGGRKCASHLHYAYILRGDASYSNGEPVHVDQVLGRVIVVERNNRSFDPYSFNHKFCCWARKWGARLIRFFFRI